LPVFSRKKGSLNAFLHRLSIRNLMFIKPFRINFKPKRFHFFGTAYAYVIKMKEKLKAFT
jgi:hypothetical protein